MHLVFSEIEKSAGIDIPEGWLYIEIDKTLVPIPDFVGEIMDVESFSEPPSVSFRSSHGTERFELNLRKKHVYDDVISQPQPVLMRHGSKADHSQLGQRLTAENFDGPVSAVAMLVHAIAVSPDLVQRDQASREELLVLFALLENKASVSWLDFGANARPSAYRLELPDGNVGYVSFSMDPNDNESWVIAEIDSDNFHLRWTYITEGVGAVAPANVVAAFEQLADVYEPVSSDLARFVTSRIDSHF